MKSAEIELTDALYERAQQLARAQDSTVSALLSKVLEEKLELITMDVTSRESWFLPEGHDLGKMFQPVEEWRLLANES